MYFTAHKQPLETEAISVFRRFTRSDKTSVVENTDVIVVDSTEVYFNTTTRPFIKLCRKMWSPLDMSCTDRSFASGLMPAPVRALELHVASCEDRNNVSDREHLLMTVHPRLELAQYDPHMAAARTRGRQRYRPRGLRARGRRRSQVTSVRTRGGWHC